ncbi:16S rRNA (uracil(1498)-N(3))-methyltransferase [Carnobacteriaceae bacterium zg-ZUI252]|nr:16S rRNA (uracil(1498)-N(3))-methyltransferase [Carnobacteriaceae bacterium zg-ZUI252]
MQRYFLKSDDKNALILDDEQTHHVVRVMRMRAGQRIEVVLSNQQAGVAEITAIDDTGVTLQWVLDDTTTKELLVNVTIACGLPKGDKLEWIVQKATELGASAFQPFETAWSVVKWENKKQSKKIERLQKIAQEAAEQSHRNVVPTVQPFLSSKAFLETLKEYDVVIVAYEETAKEGQYAAFKQVVQTLKSGQNVLAIFGAEGGLSAQEVASFVQENAVVCGLGPRIMRAETAPLYVLSALSYALELN